MPDATARIRGAFGKALEQTQAELRSLKASGSPLQKAVIRAAGPVDKKQNVAAFSTQGGASGAAWAPLSPEYAKAKAKRWPGRKILVASGKMRTASTMLGDPDRRVYFGGGTLQLGTANPLAAIHQKGFRGQVTRTVERGERSRIGRFRKQKIGGDFRAKGGGSTTFSYVLRLPARPVIRKTFDQRDELLGAIESAVMERVSEILKRHRINAGAAKLGSAGRRNRLRLHDVT